MNRLVIIGSVALDDIDGPAGKRDSILGGSATYACYAASFFAKPELVACIGKDFPAKARKVLEERPIDLAGLATLDGPTFRWSGKYAPAFASRETLSLSLGVFQDFSPKLGAPLPPGSILFLGNIDPDLQLNVLEQAGPDAYVAADTIDHWIKGKRDVLIQGLKRTNLIFLNDEEARLLTGEDNLIKAGAALRAMGPSEAVIKKGEHGALLFTAEGICAMPALPLESVNDPTGAGDSFAGAMLGVLAASPARDDAALRAALARATVMASFTVADFGVGRLRALTNAQIDERLDQLRALVKF
jgi:sugar/nucleoside kinase (ribokinase family)